MRPWAPSREVIWGSQISGAKVSAEKARQRAAEAVREAVREQRPATSARRIISAARSRAFGGAGLRTLFPLYPGQWGDARPDR